MQIVILLVVFATACNGSIDLEEEERTARDNNPAPSADNHSAPFILGDNSSALLVPVGNNSAPLIPGDNSSALLVPSSSAPSLPGDNSSAPLIPGENSSAPIIPAVNHSAPLIPRDNSSAPIIAADNSFAPLIPGDNSSAPLIPGDNSHYVDGKSRYIWIPDGEGKPHLVDLEERPSEDEIYRAIASYGNNQYWLFTRNNSRSAQIIRIYDNSSVWDSNYQSDRPIIVIVHGWWSNGFDEINIKLTAAFLHVMDANVIVLDWRDLAHYMYWTAVSGVPNVGSHLGVFLTWLVSTHGGNWDKVHLVGYSLGAHIVGHAGRKTGNKPNRITGLDPAGPLYIGSSDALRATDGKYVECIHTDGGVLGMMGPNGHADFYPNGGKHPQPGCWISTCSHSRAYELMAATVYLNHLIGKTVKVCSGSISNCTDNGLHMGNSLWDKVGSGMYELSTKESWPF